MPASPAGHTSLCDISAREHARYVIAQPHARSRVSALQRRNGGSSLLQGDCDLVSTGHPRPRPPWFGKGFLGDPVLVGSRLAPLGLHLVLARSNSCQTTGASS